MRPTKKELLKMDRKIRKQFESPVPPFPVFGKTRPNALVTIRLGNKTINSRANKDGEWLIDLLNFWFIYKIDYTKFKSFKIKIVDEVPIDLETGVYQFGDLK